MKTIKIIPQVDTVTICLPEEWVGKQVVCKLSTTPVRKRQTEKIDHDKTLKII
jgi:hypothetical protein